MTTPKHYSIVSGVGESEYELVAFDKALLASGIGNYNLVKVSSIVPPNCEFVDHVNLPKGSILYAAYATKIVKEGQIGSTAVAVAFPKKKGENGVIFESSSDDKHAESLVVNMCKEAMANREMEIQELQSSSIDVKGIANKCLCAISAVVMW